MLAPVMSAVAIQPSTFSVRVFVHFPITRLLLATNMITGISGGAATPFRIAE